MSEERKNTLKTAYSAVRNGNPKPSRNLGAERRCYNRYAMGEIDEEGLEKCLRTARGQ